MVVLLLVIWGRRGAERESEPAVAYCSGPLGQEVYVWQRVWTESVRLAVAERSPEFQGVTVQAGMAEWHRQAGWEIMSFEDPLAYAAEHEVTLALRIGAGAAVRGWKREDIDQVLEVLARWAPLTGTFQLDYDCPSGKLADYTVLCEEVRRAFPQHRLEITCLPDWLERPSLARLVAGVDRYVMQVHGVAGFGGAGTLCDPELARRTATRCAALGVPYLLALPTYRHGVRRSRGGRVVEVVSEGSAGTPGAPYELVSAREDEMAGLVRDWEHQRPTLMEGLIWYRLPVEGESMNWSWASLRRVMRGESGAGEVALEVVSGEDGVSRLFLNNATDAHLEWPERVVLQWEGGFCIVADGGEDYRLGEVRRSGRAQWHWRAETVRPLLSGTRVELGWVRLGGLSADPDGGGGRGGALRLHGYLEKRDSVR